MAIIRVVAQPYGYPVVFTDDHATFDRLTGCDKDTTSLGSTALHRKSGYVVGVFDGNTGTLVHELVHCALGILARCGMDPQDSNGEAMAYLTDWLFTQGSKLLKA